MKNRYNYLFFYYKIAILQLVIADTVSGSIPINFFYLKISNYLVVVNTNMGTVKKFLIVD